MKKRLLSGLLVLCLIFTLLPVSAFADTAKSGTCGENLTWTLQDGVLNISGTGEMYNYGDWDNHSPWDYMNNQIIDVVIDEGVTQIGSYAFYGCGSIESFSIPSTVTSISYGAFKYCDSLKSITIPDGVTSIERETFSCCESLNSITIPDSVTYIGKEAFNFCGSLNSITIPEGVDFIGNGAFAFCRRLESINIPASLESLSRNVFTDCNSLTAINISEDNPFYSSDNGVWYNKDKTELIMCPIAFEQESYNIPNGVTSISYRAFQYCKNLKTICIPDGVISIGNSAFSYCSALESINIPDSVEDIGTNLFYECNSLKAINVGENNQILSSDRGVLYNKDKTALIMCPGGFEEESYIVPEGVTSISYYAFQNCKNLKSISLPNSVTSIGDYAFCNSGLESVVIPNGVTEISYHAFEYCENLKSVTLPDSVTSINSDAFSCSGLESIDISDNVVHIGRGAFSECGSLKAINVGENNPNYSSDNGVLYNKDKTVLILLPKGFEQESYTIPDGVTRISYGGLQNCKNLKHLSIPGSIGEIYTEQFREFYSLESVTLSSGITRIGNSAFVYCSALKSITIPDTVTKIGRAAFEECISLESIDIPDNVVHIGRGAFSGCDSLKAINVDENNPNYSSDRGVWYNKDKTELLRCPAGYESEAFTVPETVTSISYYAFRCNKNLKTISIPNSVQNIGESAFSSCWSLESVNIPDGVTDLGSLPFFGCNCLREVIVGENNPSYSSINGVLFNKDKTVLIKYTAGSDDLSYTIPDSVTELGSAAFEHCRNLKILNIPAGITTIPAGFCGSLITSENAHKVEAYPSSLTTINVDENNPNYSSVDGVLFNKDKTVLLRYPGSREAESYTVPEGVTSIGADPSFSPAFMDCANLKTVTLPTSMTSIAAQTFTYSGSIEYINIPDSVTNIGSLAFYGCVSLKSLVIPNSVTTAGHSLFVACPSLERVVWSNQLNEMYLSSLVGCDSLKELYIPASVTMLSDVGGTGESNFTGNVYYEGTPEQWNKIVGYGVYRLSDATVYYNHTTEHSFGEWTLDMTATCTENGTETRSCTICNAAETRQIDALGHDLEHHDAKAPTCTEPGWEAYDTCSRCDYTSYKEIAELGHSYEKGVCTRCQAIDPMYIEAPAFKLTTSSGKPKLTWDAVNGAEKYQVYFSTDGETFKLLITTARTSITHTSAKIGTIYYYKVKALKTVDDETVSSEFSNTKSIRCIPAAPTVNITTASGKPKLSWKAVTGADSYNVYYSTDGVNYSLLITTTKTSVTHTSAVIGTTYYYKIKAVAVIDDESILSGNSAVKSIRCIPAAPTVNITTAYGKPKLSWNAITGADSYNVYYSTDGESYSLLINTTKTSVTHTSAVIGTTYYYKVKAVAVIDDESIVSGDSAVKSMQCKPKAPTVTISRANGKPRLTWKVITGADKYYIYRSTDGTSFSYLTNTSKTSYINSGASSGTKYYYKVTAVAVINDEEVESGTNAAKSMITTLKKPTVKITTANGKPKLTWNAVTGANKYEIYRSIDGVNYNLLYTTTSTAFTNTGAKKNTKYYYKVKAICSVNSNANSTFSNIVSIKATK